MSRLYNTLEKIRIGERSDFPGRRSAPATGAGSGAGKNRKRRIVLLAGLAGIAVLALVLAILLREAQRKDAGPPIAADAVTAGAVTANAVTPERTAESPADPPPQAENFPAMPPPPQPSRTVSPAGTAELYRQLNDAGIALIQKNQHWRGIYSLEQARKQQPERPEALINMAVALTELGLRGPAKRLFSEAHALAPNHPLLRKNLDLLGQADFFDPQWLSSLNAAQAQPGQTPKPQ